MRKFKKIALLCALLMIAAIGTTAGANAGERSVAKTAVSAEGTEAIADTNLTIADSTLFDGVRVSITGQVESDAPAEKYARRTVLYAGIGEGDRDLSEAESISVKLKFVTANSNRIFIVLADGTGNTAVSKFFVNRPNDGKPLGSKFYNESGVDVSLTEASGSAWEGVAAKATITAAYATENSIVLGRKTAAEGTAAPSYDVWKRFVTEPDSDYGDISAYEAFSFDLDSTSLASDGKIEFELRVKNIGGEKGADGNELAYIAYRGYGNGTTSDNYFHLIDGEGNLKTNSSMGKGGNIIPKGFNGSYMIPFGAFQRTVVGENGEKSVVRPTEEELKSAISLLIVFSASDYEGSETVSIGNMKLIDEFSAQIPLYAVNNELRSMRSKINDDNYETQKNLVQKAESGYENLTAEQKGLVKNYEKLAETKAAVAAYGVSLTERKIDGLETEISGENYKAAKRAYAAVFKQYEALGSDKAKVKNAEKLSAAADAIETYEAGTVSEKMNALPTAVDGETIARTRQAIDEAKNAYDELSEGAKEKVTGLDKLSAAENAVNEYDAAPVSAMLAALTESVTADNYEAAKAAFKEAQEAYAALSAGAQDKVQNTEKFAAAKGAIEAYEKSLKKKGCGGEITTSAAVLAATSAVVAVAAFAKRKKKHNAEEGERK